MRSGAPLPSRGGTTTAYYTNDLAQQQTTATSRQTWALDAALRFRSWTNEANNAGTWAQTAAKVNHYGADGDSPRWITESTAGDVSRSVSAPFGDLGATTTKTGGIVLRFVNLHGDTALALPLDAGQPPQVLDYDEYGNPKAASTTRYGWLGGKQRSAETPTGNILMGVRLYDPVSGRFLSTDPVLGGNANAYEYCSGDPVNCVDLDGRIGIVNRFKNKVKKWVAKQTARATSWAVNKFATTIGRYKCHYRYGMRVCNGGWLPLYSRGGTTIGDTFYTGKKDGDITEKLIRHESAHRAQWSRYGIWFVYMYLRAGSNPCTNRWERRAGWDDGGYQECL